MSVCLPAPVRARGGVGGVTAAHAFVQESEGLDRASFVRPLQEDEVPSYEMGIIHHAFGLNASKRDNLLYAKPMHSWPPVESCMRESLATCF